MAVTPEGKIKKMVKDVLAEFEGDLVLVRSTRDKITYEVRQLYQYWPVPSGFGASSLDAIVSYYGHTLWIETKAPSKHPTPRQELTIAELEGSKAQVFVIDSVEACAHLRSVLLLIKMANANHS